MLNVSVGRARASVLMMVMGIAGKKWIRVLVMGNTLNLAAFLINSPYSSPRKFILELLSLFA
jgi:hypothetical protein